MFLFNNVKKSLFMKIETKKMIESKITIGYKCDVCKKVENDNYPKNWFHFSSSHEGWHNDFVDSFEEYDVCSIDCFIKQVEKTMPWLDDYENDNAKIAGMSLTFIKNLLKSCKNAQ